MSTPYMNLSLPVVSMTLGPAWATMLNAALTAVDSHDHSTNYGKQIPTSALNINANLDLSGYSPYNALSLKFSSQAVALTGAANASSIYVVGGNLYYTNSAGNAVQLTSGGSVVAAAGSTIALEPTSLAGNLTIAPTDSFVVINTNTAASRTITLPDIGAVAAGRIYVVVDKTGGAFANPITINTSGTDTILGTSSFSIDSAYGAAMVISDGSSNWIVA